jgi:hypothetical protein
MDAVKYFLAGRWVGVICVVLLVGTTAVMAQDQPTPPPDQDTPQATPTIDRLAAPPTVAAPDQADDGAQLYWLWCQPCHGDQGQGLTDEWRAQYPMEDQYCWNNGCHGNVPYEDGFVLPKHVPAVIGEQSLARFRTMSELHTYVSEKMPYEYPGALSEEESLAVVAFMARAHGKWDGTTLTAENIDQFRWQPLPTATPAPPISEEAANPTPAAGQSWALPGVAALLLAGLLLGGFLLWQRQRP